METLDKGMSQLLGRMERNGERFHHITQNSRQFKTYKLLISGIFHLAFLEPGRWWVTEPEESETVEKGDHCI